MARIETRAPRSSRRGADETKKSHADRRTRRSTKAPAPLATQKLQKVLAQAGLGSRRDMELWISEGRVTVNNAAARLGMRVSSEDQIKVAGHAIRLAATPQLPRVLIYHKPEGEITSRDDPRGRPSVFERLPATAGNKWISIGRLDFNTCGLLIFTTSGELANRMMHPRFEVEREYAVRVMGKIAPDHIRKLTQGVEVDSQITRCEKIELRGGEGANQWCHIVLKEGRNRIVRRMFEKLGFAVSRLMRVRFGTVALPPRLKRGQYYEFSADETRGLLSWVAAAAPPERLVRASRDSA